MTASLNSSDPDFFMFRKMYKSDPGAGFSPFFRLLRRCASLSAAFTSPPQGVLQKHCFGARGLIPQMMHMSSFICGAAAGAAAAASLDSGAASLACGAAAKAHSISMAPSSSMSMLCN